MKKVIMIMLAIALMVPMVAGAETINIVSDEWCPYNCVPGSDRPGFGIEIAMEAYAPHDIQVNYTTQDWDAAVEDTKKVNFMRSSAPIRKMPPVLFSPRTSSVFRVTPFS
jgi:polar amino acid transport system substrate-binding protein